MANTKPTPPTAGVPPTDAKSEYTVVARRYRPQQFAELIGQEHVAQALVNALQSGRVAHAYLFTGARGVGKTSAARILAKALNCVEGPTPTPCDKCESCRAIAAGEDVDVLEIDGASNNGVDEAREIRQNVGFRPTRSRYKIYVIDEVHMLSTAAFNALLKTLEEPPEHVKFIFATTETQKIPITILSRCQRFDFAHVGPGKIFDQLKRIVAQESHQADEEALRLIAPRRPTMRDSQSLLDQLLASTAGKLTLENVYSVLGTTGDERVTVLAAAILDRDPKKGLELITEWVEQGLQIGELVEQLIGYWRALMLVSCGGPDVRELPVSPAQKQALLAQVRQASLDAILAGLEVWTATKARLRDAAHAQVLLEMAVVRLARMEDLVPLGQLVQALAHGGVGVSAPTRQLAALPEAVPAQKKNGQLTGNPSQNGHVTASELSTLPFTETAVPEIWARLIRYLSEKSPILANHLKLAIQPAIFGPNALVIRFSPGYNHAYEACVTEGNTLRIQDGLQKLTGQTVTLRMEMATGTAAGSAAPTASNSSSNSAAERRKRLTALPLFQKAAEALGAQIWHVDDEFNPAAAPKPTTPTTEDDLDES